MKIGNPKSAIQNRQSKIEKGFTLIEMVIGMTLLALIMMILYGAFHLGHQATEKVHAHFEGSQRLRSAGDILAGHIRSAYPYRFSAQDPVIFFSGEENSLIFVSAISSGMGGRGMAMVNVSWDGGAEGLLSLEEEIPVRLESQGGRAGYKNRVVLGQGVQDFRIDYMDSQSEEHGWVSRWDGKERKALPWAVRLSYREKRGEEIRWVFPIMMSVLAP